MRLVSLTCSNTEIVCALGRGDWLVGVDDHSDYPPEVVARLPRLGPDLGVDVAQVAALRPDLVLASLTVPGHERVVAQIQQAGLPYVAPAPTSVEDVLRDILTLGQLLDAEDRAFRLVEELEAGLTFRPWSGPRPPVLVEWWPKPVIVPGRRSWVTGLLERVGGQNPWADQDRESLPLDDDAVLSRPPAAVVVAWCGVPFHRYRLDVVYRRPAWRGLDALARGRVVPIPEAWLGRPGPRLLEGYRALAGVVDRCREEGWSEEQIRR